MSIAISKNQSSRDQKELLRLCEQLTSNRCDPTEKNAIVKTMEYILGYYEQGFSTDHTEELDEAKNALKLSLDNKEELHSIIARKVRQFAIDLT